MKVEVAVLGSPSLTVLMLSVDIKQHLKKTLYDRAQELCESRGGRPGLTVPNSPYGFIEHHVSELMSCVKVEVDVLGSPSLTVLMLSVDVQQQ